MTAWSDHLGEGAVPARDVTTIGSMLRDLRLRTGRSQAQQADVLSQLSGRPVTRNEISRWESQSRLPAPHWQRHIATSFGISITEVSRAVAISRTRRRQERFMSETAANGSGQSSGAIADDGPNGHFSPRGESEALAIPIATVGPADIEVMREMVTTFRRLDNRFGGGHGRLMLENYLSSTVQRAMRDGQVRGALRHDFLTVAAELYQLAGWMAYDMADRSGGRRFLQTALRIAQELESDLLTAEILAAMSHQASFHGSADSAVELALASGDSARRAGFPKVQAEAAAMEAHGLGLQGDSRGCAAALNRAERQFHTASNGEEPLWLSYFDEAYLAAKFGHALRHLKRPREAEPFARRSLEMSEGYDRGRVFNTALLAGILADQAKVEEAASYAKSAIKISEGMRSVRATYYLRDVYQRLAIYKDSQSVIELRQSLEVANLLVPNGTI